MVRTAAPYISTKIILLLHPSFDLPAKHRADAFELYCNEVIIPVAVQSRLPIPPGCLAANLLRVIGQGRT